MLRRAAFWLFTVVALDAAQASAQSVSAEVRSDSVHITNATASRVYFATFRESVLEVIEWAPCDSEAVCHRQQIRSVEPGSSTTSLAPSQRREMDGLFVIWWRLNSVGVAELVHLSCGSSGTAICVLHEN